MKNDCTIQDVFLRFYSSFEASNGGLFLMQQYRSKL